MKIRIFTNGWGRFETLYKKFALPSIQPSVKMLAKEGHDVDIVFSNNQNMLEEMKRQVRECYMSGTFFVLLPPDTVYGAETLYNMCKLVEGRNIHIAIPHLRVIEEGFAVPLPASNKQLTKYCMGRLHQAATAAFDTKPTNICHMGIHLRRIGTKIAMVHCLPTVYGCVFDEDDYKYYFEREKGLLKWDSAWLADEYSRNKVRVVGSSELCCIYELTEKDSHVVTPVENGTNDCYKRNAPHNLAFNAFEYMLETE